MINKRLEAEFKRLCDELQIDVPKSNPWMLVPVLSVIVENQKEFEERLTWLEGQM